VRESESTPKSGGIVVKCGERIIARRQVSEIQGGFKSDIWGYSCRKTVIRDVKGEKAGANTGVWPVKGGGWKPWN
jgi:hypothetical protein